MTGSTNQLDEAWDDGVILLPVAHHNLLDESKIYVEDCTIDTVKNW